MKAWIIGGGAMLLAGASAAHAQSTEAAVDTLVSGNSAAGAAAPAPAAVSAPATTATGGSDGGRIGAPPPGKGQVVFFRSGTLMGAAISCAVSENGAKLSSLFRGRYVVLAAEPGIHSYTVSSEATDTLRLEVEEGETYYSQCSIGMGFMAGRPNLSPSDKAKFDSMKLKPMDKPAT